MSGKGEKIHWGILLTAFLFHAAELEFAQIIIIVVVVTVMVVVIVCLLNHYKVSTRSFINRPNQSRRQEDRLQPVSVGQGSWETSWVGPESQALKERGKLVRILNQSASPATQEPKPLSGLLMPIINTNSTLPCHTQSRLLSILPGVH